MPLAALFLALLLVAAGGVGLSRAIARYDRLDEPEDFAAETFAAPEDPFHALSE